LLPDVNVWVAMHYEKHEHHRATLGWFNSLGSHQPLYFCRQTQLGMFRLLTLASVMSDEALTQKRCWEIYDKWITGGRAVELTEPPGVGGSFRTFSSASTPSPKTWTDAYLAAFADTAGLTLVTFDKALAAKAKRAVLLK
jgi:hypothetical protein